MQKVLSFYLKEYDVVYIDLLQERTKNWQKRVIENINLSSHCLVIETKSTYTSEWVLMELELIKKLKKSVIKIQLNELIDTLSKDKVYLEKDSDYLENIIDFNGNPIKEFDKVTKPIFENDWCWFVDFLMTKYGLTRQDALIRIHKPYYLIRKHEKGFYYGIAIDKPKECVIKPVMIDYKIQYCKKVE